MKLRLKNITLVTKLFLPSFLTLFLFLLVNIDIGYHVLFFSLIIVLFNHKRINHSIAMSYFLSVLLSFLSFFISIALYFGIGYIIMLFIDLDKLENIYVFKYNCKELLFMLPVTIISPILMFIGYHILFKIRKTNFSKIIKLTSIILLVLYGLIMQNFNDHYSSITWQFTMTLALQLILYQEELKALIKHNKQS